MPPKPFRLDSVLNLRKRQEDLAHDQFVQAKIAVERAAGSLHDTQQKLQNLIVTFEKKQNAGMLGLELTHFEEHIVYLQTELQLLSNTLKKKKEIVSRKRKTLIQKVKEHKTLSTLKERQDKAWKEYLAKKEAAILDEIAIIHYDRKNR